MATAEATLPSMEDARNIIARIDSQVYFNKLASLGIEPQTQEEARSLYELGWQVEQMPVPAEKTASNEFAGISQQLTAMMAGHSDPQVKAAFARTQDQAYQEQAVALLNQPEILKSAHVLAAANLQAA